MAEVSYHYGSPRFTCTPKSATVVRPPAGVAGMACGFGHGYARVEFEDCVWYRVIGPYGVRYRWAVERR